MSESTAKLLASLGVDTASFERGMENAGKRTRQFSDEFKTNLNSSRGVVDQLASKIGSVFAVAAVVNFAKASIQFAAQWQDISDQFGIAASEAEGFSRKITEVGGNSEKASAILRKLQEYQEKMGDTRSLSDFINATRQSYAETNNFGDIIELVGVKNASTFAAALREMKGGLNEFSDATKDATSALADYAADAMTNGWNAFKSMGAKYLVDIGLFVTAVGTSLRWGLTGHGFAEGYKAPLDKAFDYADQKAAELKQRQDAEKEERRTNGTITLDQYGKEEKEREIAAAKETSKEREKIAKYDLDKYLEYLKEKAARAKKTDDEIAANAKRSASERAGMFKLFGEHTEKEKDIRNKDRTSIFDRGDMYQRMGGQVGANISSETRSVDIQMQIKDEVAKLNADTMQAFAELKSAATGE